jgi:hypothetical protein
MLLPLHISLSVPPTPPTPTSRFPTTILTATIVHHHSDLYLFEEARSWFVYKEQAIAAARRAGAKCIKVYD